MLIVLPTLIALIPKDTMTMAATLTTTRQNDATANLDAKASDPRAVKAVAKSIYRELVDSGFREADVMALAGELLSLVATGVREKRND
jgi:hypothetical protein